MSANYHVTENKYLESILNNGLIPQQGIRSNLIGDPKTAVFYSKGYEGVIAMFFMMIERYIEYRSSEGDIHIESYETIKRMIEERETSGREVGKYLKETFNKESKIVEAINYARNSSTYKDFLGDGVCLKLDNIQEEKPDLPESTFYNSWTTLPVLSEDISIVALKNQETGDISSSKFEVINYFMSKVSLDAMKKVLYDTDSKENKRESDLLWKIMSGYYNDNKDYLEKNFAKYDLVEIPISSYFAEKGATK